MPVAMASEMRMTIPVAKNSETTEWWSDIDKNHETCLDLLRELKLNEAYELNREAMKPGDPLPLEVTKKG